MSINPGPRIGQYTVTAAVVATLIAPLLAIAYFATADGAQYLDTPTVSAWAEPAREFVGPLVTFAGPDRVYATYSQVMALVFPAVFLAALATRSQRGEPRKRSERVGWRIALSGYALFGAGLLVAGLALVPGDTSSPILNAAFVGLMIPGMLLAMIGSTVLGVVFVRSSYEPRVTSWLLTLSLPLLVLASALLGHNSLGLLPIFIAWAATAWRWRDDSSLSDTGVGRATSSANRRLP